MSETTQEIIYYVVAALLVAALIYGLYRAKRWLAGAKVQALEDLERFTGKYGFVVEGEPPKLRGTVDGIELVFDRGGVMLESRGRGGTHKLLRVTSSCDRPQRWLACARFLLDDMVHPLPELGRELRVEGDDAFNEALLLRAEREEDVPFLAAPAVRRALLDRKLRLARVGEGKVELSFDYFSYTEGAALASYDELEGALAATLAVCRPAQAARYLEAGAHSISLT